MNQKTIKIRNEEIAVKELLWRDSLHAAKQIAVTIAELCGRDGRLVFDSELITRTLVTQEELLAFVIAKSTGKEAAWVDTLTPKELLPLIETIVLQNLSADLIGSVKAIGGSVSSLLTGLGVAVQKVSGAAVSLPKSVKV